MIDFRVNINIFNMWFNLRNSLNLFKTLYNVFDKECPEHCFLIRITEIPYIFLDFYILLNYSTNVFYIFNGTPCKH